MILHMAHMYERAALRKCDWSDVTLPEIAESLDGRRAAAVACRPTVVRFEGVSTVNDVTMWVLPIPVTVGRPR